jgi:NADH-quinone oxidoreductase subunit J
MMEWVAFLIVAGAAVAFAVGLVTRLNPLHGALCLVGNLFCVAVLFLMLRAEFLAMAQVIVYAGAIMVLFIFAIMLLIPGRSEVGPDPLGPQRMLALPFAGVLGLIAVWVLASAPFRAAPPPVAPGGGVRSIGERLFTDYLFPFEVTSLLLLAALVGALTLAKRRIP